MNEELFCKHDVFMGDANPNQPCRDCIAENKPLARFKAWWSRVFWDFYNADGAYRQ